MFNDSIKNSFTLKFDFSTIERRTFNTGLDYQIDINNSSDNNSPKYLIAAHQTEAKKSTI